MIKTVTYLFLGWIYISSLFGQFTRIGSQIDGNAPNDNFGWDLALDDVGQTLVVGAPLYDDDFGQVRVYRESGGVWTQLGQDLNGNEIAQQYGFSVGLSADGKRMALGGIGGAVTTGGGHVRVYDLIGGQWVQAGSTILAEANGDQFGFSMQLSGDGNRVVAGAPKNNGNGNESGQVRVFEWQGGTWVQLGNDLDGENADDQFGTWVSISRDGNVIASGSSRNDGAGNDAGHVRVYEWQNNAWTQLGSDLDGQNADELFGSALSLSDDGRTLAVTAPLHDHGGGFGSARIYQWSSGTWMQLGTEIQGSSATEAFGQAVSLNGSGDIVAIGTTSADDVALSSGRVNVFRWDNGAWVEQYTPITGMAQFDYAGKSVDLNREGNRFAVGANLADGTQGYASVYEDSQMPVSLPEQLRPVSLTIVSSEAEVRVWAELRNTTSPVHLSLYNLLGQLQTFSSFAPNETMALPHKGIRGVYLLRMEQGNTALIRKIVIH